MTTTTRHTTAASLHAAILAAAANAPGSTKSKTEVASYFDRAERAAWFFSDGMTATQNEAMQAHVEAWHHTISTEQEHAEGELTEADEATAAPRHVTFRHATGSIKLRNTRERLAEFAGELVRFYWALYGGGEKPATTKKARATSWPALLVKVFAEQIETGAHAEALELAQAKLGCVAYDVGAGAYLAVAPQAVEELPSRLQSVYTCAKGWRVIDTVTGWGIGDKVGTGKHRSRSAAEKEAQHRWFSLSEATRQSLFTKTERCNTEAALTEWQADHGIDAPMTAADQVADVVAGAMAAAAIDAAQESAAAAELAEVAHTQADTVADVVTDVAELAEVAEPVAALAADVVAAMGGAPGTGTPGHTGHATPAQRSSGAPGATGGAGGQRIAGKSGQWVATFHTTAAGLPGMHYTGPDGHTQDMEFETGSERMRTLQAMAREADAQKQKTRRTIAPHELDPMECTAAEAQEMTDTEAAQAVNYWEGLNYHTHALALLCLRAGRDDLADECRRIEREHMETGCLGWELNEARQAVAQALKATPATHTPHPTGAQATQPAGVCPAGAPNYTDPLKTLGIDYTQPLKTLAVPPATPTDWQALVGAGVTYTGDACNAPGNGAIVAVHETPCGRAAWLTVDVMLEDGSHPKALRLNAFGDKPGYRYRLRPMLHGAPYLAQLAAAVAMREANRTATKAMADKAHADTTARLAVEFAHLERAENNHRGGTFAARNIRTELKRAFQGVKFSVTSDYSSVRVKWTDGPTDAQVNEVIGRFSTGASDTQSDYFYTVETAFSKLFGGVQYLFTDRNTSEAFTADVLAAWWPTRGESATQPTPTAQDWKKGEGLFSWRTGSDGLRDAFRKHLRETAGPTPTPAKAASKAKA